MQATKNHSIQAGEETAASNERQQTFSSQSQRPTPYSFRQIVHHACEPVHIDKFDTLMQRHKLHKCGLLKSFRKDREDSEKPRRSTKKNICLCKVRSCKRPFQWRWNLFKNMDICVHSSKLWNLPPGSSPKLFVLLQVCIVENRSCNTRCKCLFPSLRVAWRVQYFWQSRCETALMQILVADAVYGVFDNQQLVADTISEANMPNHSSNTSQAQHFRSKNQTSQLVANSANKQIATSQLKPWQLQCLTNMATSQLNLDSFNAQFAS